MYKCRFSGEELSDEVEGEQFDAIVRGCLIWSGGVVEKLMDLSDQTLEQLIERLLHITNYYKQQNAIILLEGHYSI